MKKESGTNNFSNGLVSDLNALTTPNNVLTDALNAAIITMNGNELSLQNDMGNISLVDPHGGTVQLTNGFIPIGVKENGGIIYVVSYNPTTLQTEIGSFPSPWFSPSSDASNITDPSDIIVAGTDPLTTNKIGVTLPLSTKVMNVGDPFIVNLPGIDITNLTDWLGSQNLPGGNRKFYIPKLIDITSTGEIDITNKVIAQPRFGSTNPYWFLNGLESGKVFSDYIHATPISKVQRFPNIKTGVLGIKFDLETIDEFLVKADSNGNNFPILSYIHGDSSPYKLDFVGFYILEPSSIKCDTIILNYTIYDNLTGLVIDTANNVTDVISSNIIDPLTGWTMIGDTTSLGFLISLLNSNQTIVYTIIPSNTYYDLIFSKLIINNRLDLSKDPLTWGLHPYLDAITTLNISELIDWSHDISYNFTGNFTNTIVNGSPATITTNAIELNNGSQTDIPIGYTINSSDLTIIITADPSEGSFYTPNIQIALNIYNSLTGLVSSTTISFTNNPIKNGSPNTQSLTIEKSFVPVIEGIYTMTIVASNLEPGVHNPTFNFSSTTPIISWSHLNWTGYSIYPLVGRFGTINGLPVHLDINDNIATSTNQLIYEYINYTVDVSGTYDKEGTFTIDAYSSTTRDKATFISTQSPAIIELDKPVVRFVASGGGDE